MTVKRMILICLCFIFAMLILAAFEPAHAETYHVDPVAGSDGGAGTSGDPWATLQNVLSTKMGTVSAGDTILCYNGWHGAPTANGRDNASWIYIKAAAGEYPQMRTLSLSGATFWEVDSLRIGVGSYTGGFSASLTLTGGNNLVIKNCKIGTQTSLQEWSRSTWLDSIGYVGNGIMGVYGSSMNNCVMDSNSVCTAYYGFNVHGDSLWIRDNEISGIGEDMINSGGTNLWIDHNYGHDMYLPDASAHGDCIQLSSTTNAELTRNRFIWYTPGRTDSLWFYGATGFQGIGCFAPPYDNILIANNALFINHLHGITLEGATNSFIVNNTAVQEDSARANTTIRLINNSDGNHEVTTDSFSRNNVANDFAYGSDPTIIYDHNLTVTRAETWNMFTDVAAGDLSLKEGAAAIDAANDSLAPAVDLLGTTRPQGPADDQGAYEFTGTSGGGGTPHVPTNWYVHSVTGNDGNNGTFNSPFQTFAPIADSVLATDTVFLAGSFTAPLTVGVDSLTIRAWPDSAPAVITGKKLMSSWYQGAGGGGGGSVSDSIKIAAQLSDQDYDSSGGRGDDADLYMGHYDTTWRSAFLNFVVPYSDISTVTEAYISMEARETRGAGTQLKVSAVNLDNTANPNNTGQYEALYETVTDSVEWAPGAVTVGHYYQTPDLAAAVNTVVSRGGWSAGNNVAFLISDNGGSGYYYWRANTYNAGADSGAVLYITYTQTGGGGGLSDSCFVRTLTGEEQNMTRAWNGTTPMTIVAGFADLNANNEGYISAGNDSFYVWLDDPADTAAVYVDGYGELVDVATHIESKVTQVVLKHSNLYPVRLDGNNQYLYNAVIDSCVNGVYAISDNPSIINNIFGVIDSVFFIAAGITIDTTLIDYNDNFPDKPMTITGNSYANLAALQAESSANANGQSADPLLIANYALDTGSPAIDAGLDVDLPYNGSAPDQGAYESSSLIWALTLTAPTNSMLTSGEETDITWVQANVESLYIEWTADNGDNWSTVAPSLDATDLSYTWTIPDTSTTQMRVRLTAVDSTYLTSVSDLSNTIDYKREITVLDPNGGETMSVGNSYAILFHALAVDSVKVEYSGNNGGDWSTEIVSLSGDSTAYMWAAPGDSSTAALIKITDVDSTYVTDSSDAVFTVLPARVLAVTAPESETLMSGQEFDIEWTETEVDSIQIEWSADNGSNWADVNVSVDATALAYTWTIPDTASVQTVIRITDVDSTYVTDTGDVNTLIYQREVTVIAPNGSEEIGISSSYGISFHSLSVDSVMVEFSTDNGGAWDTLTVSLDATLGAYIWSTPADTSTAGLIRVTDVDSTYVTDNSDAVFNLVESVAEEADSNGGVTFWLMQYGYKYYWFNDDK